jgi:hypothetical protein
MAILPKAALTLVFAMISQASSAESRPRYALTAKPEDVKYVEVKYAEQLKIAESIVSTLIGTCENKLRFLDGDTSGRLVEIQSESPISYNIEREIRLTKKSLAEQMNSDIVEDIDVYYNIYPNDNGKMSVYRVSEGTATRPTQATSNENGEESQYPKIQWSQWYDAKFSRDSWYRDKNIVGADILWINITMSKSGQVVTTIPKIADRPNMGLFLGRLLGIFNKELMANTKKITNINFKQAPLDCSDDLKEATDAVSFMRKNGFSFVRVP